MSTPSSLQMTLAMALVKSKPADTTIRAYLVQLRADIQSTRGPQIGEARERHLDNVAYWKTKYEAAESKCIELQHRIVQLERERDMLEHQAGNQNTSAASSTTRKRGTSKQQAAAPKTSKKMKTSKARAPDPHELDPNDTISDDLSFLDGLGKAGQELAASLYAVHRLCKGDRIDMGSLTFHLVQTARFIGSVISKATTHHIRDFVPVAEAESASAFEKLIRLKEKVDLPSTIRASARAFTSLLVALDEFPVKDENRSSNIVIYECVKMFQLILDTVAKSAQSIVAFRTSPNIGSSANSSARRRATKETKEADPSRILVQFANALMSYLDRKNPLHRELFEGFFFVLLDKIGKRLCYCTFGSERSRTIEGDILKSQAREDASAASKHDEQIQSLQQEVPSLVAILERAVALAPYHLNHRLASGTSKAPKTASSSRSATMNPNLPGGKRALLSDQAKDRLQRTLVNCVFGEDKPDELSDCLRMPARFGGLPAAPKLEDKDVGEWFQAEVWRLVGWDVLVRDDKW